MLLGLKRFRPKPSPAGRRVVRPTLEILEGREPPSGFQPSGLLTTSLGQPLALASAAVADAQPEVPVMPLAIPDQGAAPASSVDPTQVLAGVPAVSSTPVTVSNPPVVGDPTTPPPGGGRMSQTPAPPFISEFHACEGTKDWWTFQGVIEASNPAGLIIHFSGLPSLKDQTTAVNADGTFRLPIRLQNGEEGMATAQTTDWDGQASNIAQDYVHQTNGVPGARTGTHG
jgi:hypothetical protein